ncbi:iron chelate uptake ABC transporter family permease subunit [Mesorhizobium sp.]|uniref:iron chelate uptake ABC transporter family permease subunit n=2 Tax=unclassified Mesorhizobium TaxID=325217 RepID=UPI000FE50237|nr:iron chelate uptake ABC transporter family permease subunit [Mesorhizobium sp.]RWG51868.1 MAG: iron ABC transporter permease [Mesorhizobium sp.]RWH44852.1 MAG: iron ABC transporter permease [Mesorhizobium sp.]RWH59052.1 MAG: iron ABC transporter permease [Mesorhizobium sp.]RWI78251.1 MAG: iron ABC transporter permease [Mesorhizobium sp.]RWI79752.1 MAG: iron ABC transporter permease [Mesorhizobium sp.]
MTEVVMQRGPMRLEGRLAMMAAVAVLVSVAFMTIGLRGNLAFVIELRALRLAAMVLVGVAVAVSTVVFQTVCANRIITPSIMGLDALYVFCQTALVFALSGFGFAGIDPRLHFLGNFTVMKSLALALFLPMLRRRFDLTLMLLTGVVLGVLFRSLTTLLARLLDPNDFAVLQGAVFASFNTVEPDLMLLAGVITVAGVAIAWRARHVLDVLALGTDTAIGLGVAWRGMAAGLLVLVAALVSASTALVGPMAFLGLLVVSLAERIVGTNRHAILLPAAAFTAIIVLVGGQTILQHALGGEGSLGIVVEFAGGLVFLAILFAAGRR